jgi:hypothetical protein
VFGQHRYGERAKATLMQHWVARLFETYRQREVLSFAHHQELAKLPPAEATRCSTPPRPKAGRSASSAPKFRGAAYRGAQPGGDFA